jgi:membrane-bound metal-dependent hydrolase YbcI (DUF457 family)
VPSPVGHFLGGVAVGWLIWPAGTLPPAGRPLQHTARQLLTNAFVFGCAAVVPDLDILFGSHRTVTHSIAAALLTFAISLAIYGQRHTAFAAALAAAVASHVLLDSFTGDPIGLMLFWPVSKEQCPSIAAVFLPIRVFEPGAFAHDVIAVTREVLILLPIVVLIGWLRRPNQ